MNTRGANSVVMIVLVVILLGAATWFFLNSDEETNTNTNTTANQNTNTVANTNSTANNNTNAPSQAYLDDPQYCEQDTDCVVATNGCNGCYKSYYNKYATAEIAETESDPGPCTLECPQFSDRAVCVEHACTGDETALTE